MLLKKTSYLLVAIYSALIPALLSGCATNQTPFKPSTAPSKSVSTFTPSFAYTAPILPEAASGYSAKPGWATKKFAVAAANPLATDAGYQILKAGGSAVDAAVAVQMVLGLELS